MCGIVIGSKSLDDFMTILCTYSQDVIFPYWLASNDLRPHNPVSNLSRGFWTSIEPGDSNRFLSDMEVQLLVLLDMRSTKEILV